MSLPADVSAAADEALEEPPNADFWHDLEQYSLSFVPDPDLSTDGDSVSGWAEAVAEGQAQPQRPWACAECYCDNAAGAALCDVCSAERPTPGEKFWGCVQCGMFNRRQVRWDVQGLAAV